MSKPDTTDTETAPSKFVSANQAAKLLDRSLPSVLKAALALHISEKVGDGKNATLAIPRAELPAIEYFLSQN